MKITHEEFVLFLRLLYKSIKKKNLRYYRFQAQNY